MVELLLENLDSRGLSQPFKALQVAMQRPDIVAMLQTPGQGIVDTKIIAIMLHRFFNVTPFQ